jgi:two-component system, chemotaxis family, sensor histidine kinase and response regulator WspE
MSGDDLSNFSMLELFRVEVVSHTQALNEGLLALEQAPGDMARIEPLMRAAHSIKGAARIVGIDAAVGVAHEMEDCFVAAQEGKILLGREAIDTLLKGVDLINQLSSTTDAELDNWVVARAGEISTIVDRLRIVKATAPATGSARPPVEAPPPPRAPAVVVDEAAEASSPVVTSSSSPLESTSVRKGGRRGEVRARVVRVSADNINRLMGLAGEALVEARRLQPFSDALYRLRQMQAALADSLESVHELLPPGAAVSPLFADAKRRALDCRQLVGEQIEEIDRYARRADDLTSRLYREVISSRMRPFEDGVTAFPRMVRDLARTLGKDVHLNILGGSVGVDREILEKLEAPLTHMLRNAVDHGIETPSARAAADKPARATIRLEARHWAGMLSITISDDGRGIDPERLRRKVVERGMVTAEVAAGLTEPELMDFIFLPGFSTAESVSEISGRGVGLDVVQSVVTEVGGNVRAVSELGKGTSFHLQLPITLSVIRAVLVNIAGEPYAFPLNRIDRVLTLSMADIHTLENRQFFVLEGKNVGLLPAQQLLELEGDDPYGESMSVIVISDRTHQFGLVVDRFMGEHDLVVRPLDPRLGKVQDVSAAAITKEGTPVLIIDVEDAVRSIAKLLNMGDVRKLRRGTQAVAPKAKKRILVVEDSITVREVQRQILANRGYEVEVAVDGMDGWNSVRQSDFDLVISDVDMPRMNGIELVRQIKDHPRLKHIPVMIVSYKDREEDRLRGMDAGANHYLTKSSFRDESFVEAVADLIGDA